MTLKPSLYPSLAHPLEPLLWRSYHIDHLQGSAFDEVQSSRAVFGIKRLDILNKGFILRGIESSEVQSMDLTTWLTATESARKQVLEPH